MLFWPLSLSETEIGALRHGLVGRTWVPFVDTFSSFELVESNVFRHHERAAGRLENEIVEVMGESRKIGIWKGDDKFPVTELARLLCKSPVAEGARYYERHQSYEINCLMSHSTTNTNRSLFSWI